MACFFLVELEFFLILIKYFLFSDSVEAGHYVTASKLDNGKGWFLNDDSKKIKPVSIEYIQKYVVFLAEG